MLVVYALVLLGFPAARAGLLRVHLAVEDHGAAARLIGNGHGHGHGSAPVRSAAPDHGEAPADHWHASAAEAVRHAHDGREHTHPPASPESHGHHAPADARADPPVAPFERHAHGGVVHTHEPLPAEDPAPRAAGVSEFYLAVLPSPLSPPVSRPAPPRPPVPSPLEALPTPEPPPPRS